MQVGPEKLASTEKSITRIKATKIKPSHFESNLHGKEAPEYYKLILQYFMRDLICDKISYGS